MKPKAKLALLLGLVLVVILILALRQPPASRPVPAWLLPGQVPPGEEFIRYLPVEAAQPIAHVPIPQHPYMAAGANSNMHNDASMSDAYPASGPLGIQPRVFSRSQGFGGYGTIAFDSAGRLVAVYSNARRFQLELMHPTTLEELASYDLPPRSLSFLIQGVMPWEYIGAGMYFYLDHLDRAVLPTTRNTVQVVQVPPADSPAGFQLVREYDLSAYVTDLPFPAEDSVAWVLPDWGGAYYWFATTAGVVGTLHMDTGKVQTLPLAGEIIENSFAIGPEGVFILSDQALYRFQLDNSGAIQAVWRLPYDPGPAKKPGLITRGSGTSVTLLGDEGGFVAVTDNAEPQIHLLFIRRTDGAEVCRTPLFTPGRSATDITVIGFEHADAAGTPTGVYSAIAENNWGRNTFPIARPEPGITRVDLIRQTDGNYRCPVVWTSQESNLGVFKLSLGNGLVYTYFHAGSPLFTRWYFTAIDFTSGKTAYKALTGTGMGFNNWAGGIFLHPQGGLLYSTTIFGLVAMQDTPP
jgi:hypothetical protein